MLSTLVLGFGFAALAAVGFQRAPISFNNASLAMLVALGAVALLPAAIAAIAPRNFWFRLIYAGLAAGLLLAARRLALQSEIDFGPLDPGDLLAGAAAAAAILAVGAPLWRSVVGLSLIGQAAVILATGAALAVAAVETDARTIPTAGASVGLAAGVGIALAAQIAAGFVRSFAEGADHFEAAAGAAREAVAPAIFAVLVGVAAIFSAAVAEGAAPEPAFAAARISAAAILFTSMAATFVLSGALALKRASETTAVAENARRAAMRPFLGGLRKILSPSSAMAASAIFLIAAIVAAFQTETPASVGEMVVVVAVAVAASITFVSLRTAAIATIFLIAAGRLAAWAFDLFGYSPPTETSRLVALALAACVSMQLFVAWRDRRAPRRKSREVAQLALADSLFAAAASAALAPAALIAAEASGLWSEGVETALLTGLLLLMALLVGPALITAASALSGRE